MRLRVAVVTPSYNRSQLLTRLHHSLLGQTALNFSWVLIDDASTDGTAHRFAHDFSGSPFETVLIRNSRNRGKAACLNLAFRQHDADFFLVVDSDDYLVPDALESVQRKVSEYRSNDEVGALLFEYREGSGGPLRPYDATQDIVATRLEHDAKYTKYDGCIGYYRRTVNDHSYPEYSNETYVGPTVLQMLMAPRRKIVFTPVIIGVAEYQEGGLTHSGRRLRVQNPMGMRIYSALKFAQSPSSRAKWLQGALFVSYDLLVRSDPDAASDHMIVAQTRDSVSLTSRIAGWVLSVRWRMLRRSG